MTRDLEAVIFDMDGVIVDTFELYYIANKRVADCLGVPFTRTSNERFRGIGRKDIIEILVCESGISLSDKEKKDLAESKNIHYQDLLNSINENSIMPKIMELIKRLKEQKIKIAIASSSTNSEKVLKKLNVFECFEYIVDPLTLEKGKPDPEIFLKAVTALNVKEENCIAIEDGDAGIQAIKSTKMFSVGIGNSDEIKKADWHITSTNDLEFDELLKRFKEERNGGK